VLVPIGQHIRTLNAARLAADVAGVPSIIIARTDSLGANLLTSDIDERDREFTTGERSPEGFYYVQPGIDMAVARGLAYAPYADLLWCETATPDLGEARIFAERIRAEYPDKLLAYNCSPSFDWREHLDDDTIASFQRELGAMGYALQFVTLAGDSATRHQRDGVETEHSNGVDVGAGYFDDIATTISGGTASTLSLVASTEAP
jgi:isocitrate lyase